MGIGLHILTGSGFAVKAMFRGKKRHQLHRLVTGQDINSALPSAVYPALIRHQPDFFPFDQVMTSPH